MNPINYIRRHPFSVMALCNIIGDVGYVGFAFAAQGLVSLLKLGGALFTVAAHIILLAYGDDQSRHVKTKDDYADQVLLHLRRMSYGLLQNLPMSWQRIIRAKPVGIGFAMLSLNGVGLLMDAMMSSISWANLSQIMLGACIMIGCGAFSLADYVKQQQTANFLLKIAPSILSLATAANAGLALTTLNGFLIFSLIAFLISNFAGFYTKIDKAEEWAR